MSNFEKGQLVKDRAGEGLYEVISPKVDTMGRIPLMDQRIGSYLLVKESILEPAPITQEWVGIEIDRFDQKHPDMEEPYYMLSLTDIKGYLSSSWDGRSIDLHMFELGIYTDIEVAARNFPKMVEHLKSLSGVNNASTIG